MWLIHVIRAVIVGAPDVWDWLRRIGSGDWPTIGGTVQLGEVEQHNRAFTAQLGYSYNVGGKYYSGYYRVGVQNPDDAWFLINRAKGQRIVVRYDPRKPQVSAVREADNRGFLNANVG